MIEVIILFILGFFLGALLEFVNWFWLAPLISRRKFRYPMAYLPYDKVCKEDCDGYLQCYEVNCAKRRNDE